MESIKEIFKIGNGPSSSHTMGPCYACEDFVEQLAKKKLHAEHIKVTLYSSLAWTGHGHLTDVAIKNKLKDFNCEVIFDYKTETKHPNTLKFEAYDSKNNLIFTETYLSIGGGYIQTIDGRKKEVKDIYQFKTFDELTSLLTSSEMDIIQFIDSVESNSLETYLNKVIDAMIESVDRGLKADGTVAFELKVKRVAGEIYQKAKLMPEGYEKTCMLLTAFAYATSEENAAGGVIVTAPTAGSCGVLASLVYYYLNVLHVSREEIINALKVAGMIGLIVKTCASISGSVAGCQAEIGTASSMGAAFCSYLAGLTIKEIGYAAEVSLEHSLGLTCDPVHGYVAIPCIERNGFGVLRAYDGYLYSKNMSNIREAYVKLDDVISVMYETGIRMHQDLKETSRGGLATIKHDKEN